LKKLSGQSNVLSLNVSPHPAISLTTETKHLEAISNIVDTDWP